MFSPSLAIDSVGNFFMQSPWKFISSWARRFTEGMAGRHSRWLRRLSNRCIVAATLWRFSGANRGTSIGPNTLNFTQSGKISLRLGLEFRLNLARTYVIKIP
jgi:hypothetical protein